MNSSLPLAPPGTNVLQMHHYQEGRHVVCARKCVLCVCVCVNKRHFMVLCIYLAGPLPFHWLLRTPREQRLSLLYSISTAKESLGVQAADIPPANSNFATRIWDSHSKEMQSNIHLLEQKFGFAALDKMGASFFCNGISRTVISNSSHNLLSPFIPGGLAGCIVPKNGICTCTSGKFALRNCVYCISCWSDSPEDGKRHFKRDLFIYLLNKEFCFASAAPCNRSYFSIRSVCYA